jgi:hypothetical protein
MYYVCFLRSAFTHWRSGRSVNETWIQSRVLICTAALASPVVKATNLSSKKAPNKANKANNGKNKKATTQQRQATMPKASVLLAAWQNVLSWFVRTFVPSQLPRLLPKCSQEDSDTSTLFAQSSTSSTSSTTSTTSTSSTSSTTSTTSTTPRTTCISIGRPGGVEQLRVVRLKPDIMTCGYNVPGQDLPFTKAIRLDADVPPDCIVLRNEAFSVNYADCCIRYVSLDFRGSIDVVP